MLGFVTVGHSGIRIDIPGLSSFINSFLQWFAQLFATCDLIDFLTNEVTENSDRFTILSIYSELNAARILMESDERAAIRFSHNAVILFNYANACSWNGVWVPQIDDINDKLWWNVSEEIVPMMMLINVAFQIWRLLKEKVCVGACCISSIYLGLSDQLAASAHLADLKGLRVVQTDVALWLPLASLFLEAVEVACTLVEKNAPRRQVVQNIGTLVALDGLDEASFFTTIDHV